MTISKSKLRDQLPYRPCVGMMVLNDQGHVFAGKRVDQTLEGWQMPQGGIDGGETPQQAAFRELAEEIGTRNVAILREHSDWLTYELPDRLLGQALQGRYRGQKQKWFAMRFLGQDREINLKQPDQEFSEWKWLQMEELPRLIVPFKRDTYAKVIEAFRDLAD